MVRKTQKKGARAIPQESRCVGKVPTHITGLDEVLRGGLPVGRTSLVSGGPGSGKSILGLGFLYQSAMSGEPGIFVTFEERAEAVRQNALTMGWDLASLEADGKLFVMEARVDPHVVRSGDFSIKALLAIIEGQARAMGANRIVIDAIDVLLRLFDDPKRERDELYALHDWLIDHALTTLITVKAPQRREYVGQYEFLDFMVDCVIEINSRIVEQIATRRIRIVKCRGSGFGRNEYPFVITGDGLHVIPITEAGLQHQALGGFVSSGQSQLDVLLGGGYRTASAIMFTGASGTGKSTLAATFAAAACRRGESVLYINFEESQNSMLSCMLSPGIDLRPFLEDETLHISTALPEAMGAEEHLVHALNALREFEPDYVVVDAISACQRMGSERGAFEYTMRLINACKTRGMTIILLNQSTATDYEHGYRGTGISSLVDTIVALRNVEVGGEVNRTLLVAKSRGSKHSNQYREFLITDQGIDLMDVYVGGGGVLTGVARQEQEARERGAQVLRQQEIEGKMQEVERLRAISQTEAVRQDAVVAVAEAELEGLRLALRVIEDGDGVRRQRRGDDGKSGSQEAAPRPRASHAGTTE